MYFVFNDCFKGLVDFGVGVYYKELIGQVAEHSIIGVACM
jgi:hypothetical protein